MPQAVTHILVPLIIAALVRDSFKFRKNKKFSLHYVLIAGLGGALPDVDIAVYWIAHFFGANINQVHRAFTHTIFFTLLLIMIGLLFHVVYNKPVTKHKLKLSWILYTLAFGMLLHLALDAILSGYIRPFYPFYNLQVGLNLVMLLPFPLSEIFLPSLDGALLVIWLLYLELRHKISDFI